MKDSDLNGVRVGDAVRVRYYPDSGMVYKSKVLRVLKTQVEVRGRHGFNLKVRIKDGYEVGADYMGAQVFPWTSEDEVELINCKKQYLVNRFGKRLESLLLSEISQEDYDLIVKLNKKMFGVD